MKYISLDLETENVKAANGHPSLPSKEGNYIVSCCLKEGEVYQNWYFDSAEDSKRLGALMKPYLDECDYIFAHNSQFEFIWLRNVPEIQEWLLNGGFFLDTMQFEYLLGGMHQAVSMLSLDKLAPRYGGTLKDDAVKKCWQAGMLTSEINKDTLLEYGWYDVENLSLIVEGQLTKVKKLPVLNQRNIMAQLKGAQCLHEMSANGIYMDMELAEEYATAGHAEVAIRYDTLMEDIPEEVRDVFNVGAYRHKSAYLYGGPIPRAVMVPRMKDGDVMCRKLKVRSQLWTEGRPEIYGPGKREGEPKLTNIVVQTNEPLLKKGVEFTYLPGMVDPLLMDLPEPTQTHPDKKTPIYSTDAGILDELPDIPALKKFKRWSVLNKATTQYLRNVENTKGLMTLVDPEGVLYYSINTAKTKTSRLSTMPNVQNVARLDTRDDTPFAKGIARKTWRSRFPGGKIVEADYSSLETRTLAAASVDPVYMADMNDGLDEHSLNLSIAGFKVDGKRLSYEEIKAMRKSDHPEVHRLKRERQDMKALTFSYNYGAGVKLIAKNMGGTEKQAKAFVKGKEDRWPTVAKLRRETSAQAAQRPFTSHGMDYCKYTDRFGSTYSMEASQQYDYKTKTSSLGVRKQITMNAPIQGLGAVVMKVAGVKLYEEFSKRGWIGTNPDADALLVLTIHDAFVADCKPEVAEEVAALLIKVMENVREDFTQMIGVDPEVDFPADVDIGDHIP